MVACPTNLLGIHHFQMTAENKIQNAFMKSDLLDQLKNPNKERHAQSTSGSALLAEIRTLLTLLLREFNQPDILLNIT